MNQEEMLISAINRLSAAIEENTEAIKTALHRRQVEKVAAAMRNKPLTAALDQLGSARGRVLSVILQAALGGLAADKAEGKHDAE